MAAMISAAVASVIGSLMVMTAVAAPTGCATISLVLLSPCLPFISSSPNNLSVTAPSDCCKAFSSVYNSGRRICLCYFIRQPHILGFPLNSSRLIALPSVCPNNGGMHVEINSSLDSICAASPALPPLQSSMIPGIKEPDDSPPADENTPTPTPAPSVGLPGLSPSEIVTPSTPADESLPSSATAKGALTKDCIVLFLLASLLIHISRAVF